MTREVKWLVVVKWMDMMMMTTGSCPLSVQVDTATE
jgi:hypothetical protein